VEAIKRITANLPENLLKEATQITGEGITETLVRGLELVRKSQAFEKVKKLKGIDLSSIQLDTSRERNRR
jgi:hypothetical protein